MKLGIRKCFEAGTAINAARKNSKEIATSKSVAQVISNRLMKLDLIVEQN